MKSKNKRRTRKVHVRVRCFRSIGWKRTHHALFQWDSKEARDNGRNVVRCKIVRGLQLDEGLEQFAILHDAYETAVTIEWAKRIHTPNEKANQRG